MKLALIPPAGSFHYALRSNIHLVLSHVMNDPVVGSGYSSRYAMLNPKAHYIILDNGAHENDRPTDLETTLRLAQRLVAQEIVMPDVQQNAELTVELVRRAVDWLLTDEGIDAYILAGSPALMYVPQASYLGEWLFCLKHLEDEHARLQKVGIFPPHPVIGVAKKHAQFFPLTEAVRYIDSTHGRDVPVHLLGWPADEDVGKLNQYPCVRSIDTAKPFSMAMKGIRAVKELYPWASTKRPDMYFRRSIDTDKERQLADLNIEAFLRACEGRYDC